MTGFDFVVIALIALSTLFAFWRGMIREVLGLVAWIAAIVLAFMYSGSLASALMRPDWNPAVLQVVAFAAILAGVLIGGGLLARSLARAVQAVGLGLLDRALGALFGLARGLAVVLLGVLVAGVTTLPRAPWWQHSLLAAPMVDAAMQFRDWLPQEWSRRLDYSPRGTGPGLEAKLENEACAES